MDPPSVVSCPVLSSEKEKEKEKGKNKRPNQVRMHASGKRKKDMKDMYASIRSRLPIKREVKEKGKVKRGGSSVFK